LLSTSYSTICPSLSELRQARSTALICTNTSVPPPPLWLNETLALRWIEPLPGRGVAGETTGDFAVFDATTPRSSTGTMSVVHSSCESEFFGAHTGFTRPLVLPTADPDRHSSCTPSRFGRPPCKSLRRKIDRIDPTRVLRPCGCLGRSTLTPDSDEVCLLL
jgi:hypothetical protein